MRNGSRGSAIRPIQTLFSEGSVGGMTDGQLLEQFLSRQGEGAEAAFAALVGLHGPMVYIGADQFRTLSNQPGGR
jgi:hypothetical protein